MKLELMLNKSRLILTRSKGKEMLEMGNFMLEDTIIGVFEGFPCIFVITTDEKHLKSLCKDNIERTPSSDCLHFYCRHETIRDEWVEIMKRRGAQIYRESCKRRLPSV
ncbi:hypothetical protein GUITHDRAFT_153920 [Guillardia theta CCMP2712]|uniref:Uncharacterized protein n=1 Tax=Guillardia theta (strain CCMP2712) TaxID=905079 RepID=L1IXU3_GUITC|nr:hypothetical protein GUITHDRAFT_153920 [Guillardia theta CCMP2712]EKX41093.1 hypothetical protein GUITHDRAFT_153920 [Guillardia theta CCMP2712]|eukprot:XP_005828073.1 hypothetical protein GUITHDRAFT_153920 [Guillardia theta CCMP2712]